MEKSYSPQDIEEKRYQWWEESGHFKPSGKGTPFSMVIPPPNVTGVLHIGHALDQTLQDIVTRYKRMMGFDTLWVPGTDHAGIATQNVVEKHLKKEGTSRHDLGREAFVEKVWEWKDQYGGRITSQQRRLGCSVDWAHERFTMDEGCQEAVLENFVRLYEAGHLYRGERIINWCPRCKTALSDIEVEHEEKEGHLWHIRYTAEDGSEIVVATTRPETMFGDTAVAVHPEDDRYTSLLGKQVKLPLSESVVPIIADAHVDMAFGSGAVKVTPAHDPNDFEIGERHHLPRVLVLDESGVMNDHAPQKYQGMDRYECREQLVEDLKSVGALVSVKVHHHSVGQCYRCHTIIEPYLSKQWFVNMKELVKPAIEVVKNGEITFMPKRWEKLYFDWMENIKDWCVSRQIWWGHQIPVYYKKDNPDEFIVSKTAPLDSENYIQDEDVLDTWFSSALWPFSTLGWPQETHDLQKYYPTSLLITGYDIITFWVSRMITVGLEQTKTIPFSEVYIHGLVRDITGKKMSKSLGNAMDPLELIDEFGADALRFALASLATQGGQDIKLAKEKVLASRNFANKIWNVTRYLLMNLSEVGDAIDVRVQPPPQTVADKWILSVFYQTLETVNKSYETYNFAGAADQLWEFVWNYFCDWYIEATKANRERALPMLGYLLVQILKLMHPYMPFITEELWQIVKESQYLVFDQESDSLSNCTWPSQREAYLDQEAVDTMDLMIAVIREIRHLRKQLNIPLSKECHVVFVTDSQLSASRLKAGETLLASLAKVVNSEVSSTLADKPEKSASSVVGDVQVFLSLEGLIDIQEELARLEKQHQALEKEVTFHQSKLSNQGFINNAPEAVVNGIREKQEKAQTELELVQSQIQQLR